MKSFWPAAIIVFIALAQSLPAQNTLSRTRWALSYNAGYNVSRFASQYLFETPAPVSFALDAQIPMYASAGNRTRYGLTDLGLQFLYHDFRKAELGKNFGLYATGSFYLNTGTAFRAMFRLGMGWAYNTRPYDAAANPRNVLFGSHWLFPFNAGWYIFTPKFSRRWRLFGAFTVYHYSNGNIRAPNFGANIPGITLGILYDPARDSIPAPAPAPACPRRWHYALVLRGGANQSDYIGSRVFPFLIPGITAEKHLSFRHKISFTLEVFLSYFLRDQIRYETVAFPEKHLRPHTDFKRVGLYADHEFHYGTFGINTGMGYYIYYPYAFETRFYNRLGLTFYPTRHLRLSYGVKVHSFSRAEALELGVSYQIPGL